MSCVFSIWAPQFTEQLGGIAYIQCHIYWSHLIDRSDLDVGSAFLVAPFEVVEPLLGFCHLCLYNAVPSASARLPDPEASPLDLPPRIRNCVWVFDASRMLEDRQRYQELEVVPLDYFGGYFAHGVVRSIAMNGVPERFSLLTAGEDSRLWPSRRQQAGTAA